MEALGSLEVCTYLEGTLCSIPENNNILAVTIKVTDFGEVTPVDWQLCHIPEEHLQLSSHLSLAEPIISQLLVIKLPWLIFFI
jgi:hypothetical protein